MRLTDEQFEALLLVGLNTGRLSIDDTVKLEEQRKHEKENRNIYAKPRTFAQVNKRLIWK